MTDPKRIPVVHADGWHCNLSCPFLKPDKGKNLRGTCIQDQVELDWHDFYIAQCTEYLNVPKKDAQK